MKKNLLIIFLVQAAIAAVSQTAAADMIYYEKPLDCRQNVEVFVPVRYVVGKRVVACQNAGINISPYGGVSIAVGTCTEDVIEIRQEPQIVSVFSDNCLFYGVTVDYRNQINLRQIAKDNGCLRNGVIPGTVYYDEVCISRLTYRVEGRPVAFYDLRSEGFIYHRDHFRRGVSVAVTPVGSVVVAFDVDIKQCWNGSYWDESCRRRIHERHGRRYEEPRHEEPRHEEPRHNDHEHYGHDKRSELNPNLLFANSSASLDGPKACNVDGKGYLRSADSDATIYAATFTGIAGI